MITIKNEWSRFSDPPQLTWRKATLRCGWKVPTHSFPNGGFDGDLPWDKDVQSKQSPFKTRPSWMTAPTPLTCGSFVICFIRKILSHHCHPTKRQTQVQPQPLVGRILNVPHGRSEATCPLCGNSGTWRYPRYRLLESHCYWKRDSLFLC